jgi:hypothetical protein
MRILDLLLVSILTLSSATTARGKDRADPRLQGVTSVFIAGNNQAAEGARAALRRGKSCLVLVDRAPDADAVLEIVTDSQSMGGHLGTFGARNWIASGSLTLKSGELIWSHSERFGDAPFMSGGKTTGDALVRQLGRDAGCKSRKKPNMANIR